MKEEEGRTHEMKARERGRIDGRSRKRTHLLQPAALTGDEPKRRRHNETLQCYSTSNASMIDCVC